MRDDDRADASSADVLGLVRYCGRTARLVPRTHCEERMRTRRASFRDLKHALANAARIRASDRDSRPTWTVEGPDLEGTPIALVVTVDRSPPGWVEVVTLYEADHAPWRVERRRRARCGGRVRDATQGGGAAGADAGTNPLSVHLRISGEIT